MRDRHTHTHTHTHTHAHTHKHTHIHYIALASPTDGRALRTLARHVFSFICVLMCYRSVALVASYLCYVSL